MNVYQHSRTVGLTKGLTPNLTIAGKVIIIITMYLGRVGPISMAIGFSQKNKKKDGHVSGTGSDLISEIDSHYNMISQRR